MKYGSSLIIKILDSLTITLIVNVKNSICWRALGLGVKSSGFWHQIASVQIPVLLLCDHVTLGKLYNICLKPQFPYLQNSTCLLVLLGGLNKLLHVKHLKWHLVCS